MDTATATASYAAEIESDESAAGTRALAAGARAIGLGLAVGIFAVSPVLVPVPHDLPAWMQAAVFAGNLLFAIAAFAAGMSAGRRLDKKAAALDCDPAAGRPQLAEVIMLSPAIRARAQASVTRGNLLRVV